MDIFRKNKSKAIWIDHNKAVNRYVCFQTSFDANEKQNIKFYISTDTKYELYINGNLVGFGQYDDFPKQKIYDTYDIDKYIINGENLVSILAYSQGEDTLQHICGLPMVIFAALSGEECVLASNEQVKCRQAEEFVNGEFERITVQRSFNFGFDLCKDDGWRKQNVSALWDNAVICVDSTISYSPRPIAQLVLGDVITGELITQGEFVPADMESVSLNMQYSPMAYREVNDVFEKKENSLYLLREQVYGIIDLGKETAGHIVLELEAEEGAELWLTIGEHLADMRVRAAVGPRNYAFRCVCREGRQKIRFYIRRLAGRYLQFFAHKGIKTIHCLGLQEVEYPLEFRGSWKSNDRLLNRIYEVSCDTLHLCMHEHYEDCPQREQALYAMDSRNQMLFGYYAFGETKMARASLELLAKSQTENGQLEMCAPCHFPLVIPSFDLIWIIALSEYTLFSGDLDFAKEMLPTAKKLLNFFLSLKKDGTLLRPAGKRDWNFYEWTDNMDNWGQNPDIISDAPLHAFCIMSFKAYEKICCWLNLSAELKWASEERKELQAGFHDCYYVPSVGGYKNYVTKSKNDTFSQLTQSLALLAEVVPKELEDGIREKVLCKDFTETSISYCAFKYDALLMDKQYKDVVLEDIAEKWSKMLYEGATSFWETIYGEADFDRGGSLCHGWSAVPVYIFWRYVMGIYPKEIGFKEFDFKPLGFKDISAKAQLKTPQGIYNISLVDGEISK